MDLTGLVQIKLLDDIFWHLHFQTSQLTWTYPSSFQVSNRFGLLDGFNHSPLINGFNHAESHFNALLSIPQILNEECVLVFRWI